MGRLTAQVGDLGVVVNWTLIFVRAYWRALLIFSGAAVIATCLARLRGSMFEGWAVAAPWVLTAGAIAAVGLIGAATLRLRAWEADRMRACQYCSGPLGHVREGIKGRSDYRRCLQCDRCTSEPGG